MCRDVPTTWHMPSSCASWVWCWRACGTAWRCWCRAWRRRRWHTRCGARTRAGRSGWQRGSRAAAVDGLARSILWRWGAGSIRGPTWISTGDALAASLPAISLAQPIPGAPIGSNPSCRNPWRSGDRPRRSLGVAGTPLLPRGALPSVPSAEPQGVCPAVQAAFHPT